MKNHLTPLLLLPLAALIPINAVQLSSLTNYHQHATSPDAQQQQPQTEEYDVVVESSFPTRYKILNSPKRREFYQDFMKRCREKMGHAGYLCDESERIRLTNNIYQPKNMRVSYYSCFLQMIKIVELIVLLLLSNPIIMLYFWLHSRNTQSWDIKRYQPQPNCTSHLSSSISRRINTRKIGIDATPLPTP